MSNTVSPIRESPLTTMRPPLAFAVAVVSSAVVSVALSAVVATIARASGASHDFKALTFPAYTSFIVIGLLVGAIAWQLIRRRSNDPAALLRWLVPVVVLVSLIPDLAVGAGNTMAGTSWGAVLALMLMHVIVAVCGVVAYRTFLPLDAAAKHGA